MAARAFGFESTSSQLRAVLAAALDRMPAEGRLEERDGPLVRPKAG